MKLPPSALLKTGGILVQWKTSGIRSQYYHCNSIHFSTSVFLSVKCTHLIVWSKNKLKALVIYQMQVKTQGHLL